MSDCLFCNIISRRLPVDVVYEEDDFLVFRDIHPQAPVHVLIIPKQHISTINAVDEAQTLLLGQMIFLAKKIAKKENIADNGYRLVFNVNPDGGQTVYHIHLHVVGGRPMTWPPG